MRQLKFNKNGKFRILQISDLQDTKGTSVDTLEFLEAALPEIKPDLIVLTGDQLDVVGLWGKAGSEKNKKLVRQAIADITAPIRASGIPFLVTFGNHDCQTGIPNAQQALYYKEAPNCICFDNLEDGRPDAGTFNQVIMKSDNSAPALNIYVVDSNSAYPGTAGGYDSVHPNQYEWCKSMSEALETANGGKKVPSILFQHIPVCEIYDILKEVPKGTPDSKPAYRARAGKYFVRDEEKVWQSGTFGECPSAPEVNEGQFDSAVQQGDIFAMYFGHDHYNSFVGKLKGIDLGYCPGAGYNTYGLNPRGMRVFDFDENDVANYETKVIRVSDFYKKPLYQPLKNFVYTHAPESINAAIPFFIKTFAVLAVIAVILVLIGKFISGKFVAGFFVGLAIVGVIYALYSLIRNNIKRKELLSKFNKEEK